MSSTPEAGQRTWGWVHTGPAAVQDGVSAGTVLTAAHSLLRGVS